MGPSFPTRDGFTPPPHPHRRGARPTHIESDTFPRLKKGFSFCCPAWKKGSHFAGSCRLKQFRHVVFLVLRVFELRKFTYIYVYVYMYVEKVWHMYIYIYN